MPLNPQLTSCGAVFDRAVRTSADYRLFALVGQEVPKPGLTRSSNGDGVAIDAELWRLAPEAFAQFVDAVPPPLAIGTITLSDGTSAKGFIVEAAGLQGAEDISSYGGWRSFAAARLG